MSSKLGAGERFIMKRAGFDPTMIEGAMTSIHHSHAMLKDMMSEDHDKIHESCKDKGYWDMYESKPEFADYLLEGVCMYRCLAYMHFKFVGAEKHNKQKEELNGTY